MAKSYLEGLKRFLATMKTRRELPERYIKDLEEKVADLEQREDSYYDPSTAGYTVEWGKMMGDLQAEMLFDRFIFTNKKLARIFKTIAKGEYEWIEEEPDDEINELVIYSYVSELREYGLLDGLLDEVFHEPELRRQKPLFRREVFYKFFIEDLYDNIEKIALEVLEFRKIGLTAEEKDKLNHTVVEFKRKHPKEEYLSNLLPLNNA